MYTQSMVDLSSEMVRHESLAARTLKNANKDFLKIPDLLFLKSGNKCHVSEYNTDFTQLYSAICIRYSIDTVGLITIISNNDVLTLTFTNNGYLLRLYEFDNDLNIQYTADMSHISFNNLIKWFNIHPDDFIKSVNIFQKIQASLYLHKVNFVNNMNRFVGTMQVNYIRNNLIKL